MDVQSSELILIQSNFNHGIGAPCDHHVRYSLYRANTKFNLLLDQLSQFLKSVIPGNGIVEERIFSEFFRDIGLDDRRIDSVWKVILYPGYFFAKSQCGKLHVGFRVKIQINR